MTTQPLVLKRPRVAADTDTSGKAILRLRAFARRARLVREIADGADPQAEPARALCASRLSGMRTRRGLAASLANVLDAAMEGPQITSAVRVARDDVLAACPAILKLNRRLRAPGPVNPRGVAIVDRLLRDGNGPLYVASGDRSLEAAIREATIAL